MTPSLRSLPLFPALLLLLVLLSPDLPRPVSTPC